MSLSAIGKGIVAGFVATVVLSAIMVMKQTMGVMPQLDPIGMIAAMAGTHNPAIGWIGHFVIGSVAWGVGFAIVSPFLPGPFVVRGVIFGVGAWLMMMLVAMPMAGLGLFGLALGMMAPIVTLVLHVVFGLVLGGVYGALNERFAATSGARP